MRIRRATAVIVCAITAAGCTIFTGPKTHLVTISVTSDTLVATVRQAGDVSWLEFTIPVSIHNGQTSGLPVNFCLASVLTASAGEVWAPNCFLEGSSTLPMLAAGATQTFQWRVAAAISGPGDPKWGSRTVDGTYQLRLAMGAEAVFVSNEFAISVLTTSATILSP